MAVKESPFAGIQPTEKGARSLDRIRERFGVAQLPTSLATLAGSEPGINDLYMNLNRMLADGKLTEKSKLLVAVAVASTTGNAAATEFFADAAINKGRTKAEVLDAVSVAAVCSIFNGYYRFRDQVPADLLATYEAFRAPFNANTFMKCALQHVELEAICIAVSSANGCHKCVEGHLNKGKSLGLNDEQIDEIIRAGAIALAVANTMGALGEAAIAHPGATV